jgi:uncharacterized protein YjbI with pentapeptide repeats
MDHVQNSKISLVDQELPCKGQSCKDKAISLSLFCWKHTPDKIQYIESLKKFLNESGCGEKFILRKIVLHDSDLIRVNLKNADLTQADFKNSNFSYSDISNANLIGCNLENCDLTGVNFENSDLTRSSLKRARLWHADLSSANITEADIIEADLWKCQMYLARLWHTELKGVKSLTKQNFSKKTWGFLTSEKIDERGVLSAEESYRTLKQYFIDSGRYREASWASFKEKTMEKLWLRKNKNLTYIPMALMGLLSGYGEKPNRVILSSAAIIFIYSIIYYYLNAVATLSAVNKSSIWDYIYYSIVTFTTLGYGDLVPKAHTGYRLLAGSEAFIGAFMIGLFVFTLSRKYSAR